jgi:uncharacterized protein YgfB (UPF0149 family)
VLDERDALLRNQLGSVKDGSSELAALTAEAEKLIKDARSEVSAMVNAKKNEKQAELDKVYNDAKQKVRVMLCVIFMLCCSLLYCCRFAEKPVTAGGCVEWEWCIAVGDCVAE